MQKKIFIFFYLDLLFIVLLTSSVWIVSEIKKFIENGFSFSSLPKKLMSKQDFDV